MADVIGPSNRLPGMIEKSPEGTMCDEHPDRLSVKRVTGETDSFGSELHDMCQECLDKHKKYIQENPLTGKCDWCKGLNLQLVHTRDWEDGFRSRLYQVCHECKAKDALAFAQSNRDYDNDD